MKKLTLILLLLFFLLFSNVYAEKMSAVGSGSGGSGWTDGGSNVYLTTSTDNVGIGTTAPSAKLHISGNGQFKINDYIFPAGTGATGQVLQLTNPTTLDWATGTGDITSVGSCASGDCFATGNTDTLLGNRIGIGTTSTSAYLNIQSGTGSSFILKIADSGPNDRLVIQQDGNVGLGTSAPSATLDIVGTIDITGVTSLDFIKDTHIDWGTGASQVSPSDFANEDIGDITITGGSWAVEDSSHSHSAGTITEADPLAILTDGTRGLSGNWNNANYKIATLGNVGVGTTNPNAPLTVIGAGFISGNLGIGVTNPQNYALYVSGDEYITGSSYQGDNYKVIGDIGANGNVGAGISAPLYPLDIRGSGNAILNMTGNVGIGTTNPINKLDVSGTANATTITEGGNAVYNSTEVPGGELGGTWASPTIDDSLAVTSWTLTTPILSGIFNTDNNWLSGDGGAEGLMIDDNGNVGIGTTGPTKLLDVRGKAIIGEVISGMAADLTVAQDGTGGMDTLLYLKTKGNAVAGRGIAMSWSAPFTDAGGAVENGRIELINEGSGATNKVGFGFQTHNGTALAERMRIDNAGNVGIGTTGPLGRLQVGTTPGAPLLIAQDGGNVGIGTSSPLRKLDIIGAMITDDTSPVYGLSIYNPDSSFDGIGKKLSLTDTITLDEVYTYITAGTNVIFTLKVGVTGTGPYTNLLVGSTSTTTPLTVTSFVGGGTVPANQVLIFDTVSTSGAGTNTMYNLTVQGRRKR